MIIGPCSEVEELGNGRMRHVQHMRPIAYEQNGTWKRITCRMGASGDAALSVGSNELAQIRMRDKLSGNAPVVHFGKGNSLVRLTPLETTNVNGRPYGENGWEYPGAWDNADLRLIMGGHILRKEIVLRKGHPKQFSFRVDKQARLSADTLATPEFRLLDPVLEHPEKESIPLKWERTSSGGKLVLTARLPDGDWTGWTLDPTLVLQPGPADGEDVYIMSYYPNENKDTGPLFVGAWNLWDKYRILLRIIWTPPPGAQIAQDVISLYLYSNRHPSVAPVLSLHRQKRAWIEIEATWKKWESSNNWQNSGGMGVNDCEDAPISSYTSSINDPVGWKQWSLPTGPGEADLGNGWILHGSLEDSGGSSMRYFYSSDYATDPSLRPRRTIEYTLPTGQRIFAIPFSAPFRGPFL